MTGEYRHTPVLLEETLSGLNLKSGDVFVDATLGGAGHSANAISRIAPGGLLIGVDQDENALLAATSRLSEVARDIPVEFKIARGNFGQLDSLLVDCKIPGIDAILFDLGVSSHQIDIPQRGFSFKVHAPLDMRMDPGTQTLTAAEIINTLDEADLTRIIRNNSDEKWASRIAKFIVEARRSAPIEDSTALVEVIKAAIPASARRSGGHPAKRTFQALRMEVNDEIGVLKRGLDAAIRWLNIGGIIAVISYHSIEDRVVKETFNSYVNRCICPPDLPVCVCNKPPVLKLLNRKPIMATDLEIQQNPRSRSAKLRLARKL